MSSTTGSFVLSPERRDQLDQTAHQIRRDIITAIAIAGDGHPGGALGAAELFAALYFEVMRHNPQEPQMPGRDRFVLSNGHICAGLYSTLARAGYFPVSELSTHRKIGSRLQGHPARVHLPDIVETSSGPLGQGLSVANGLALAARLDGLQSRVFVLLGDGELQEGQVWEAAMTAAHYKLRNLTMFISYNRLQIDGAVDDVMGIDPIAAKLEAFNWRVLDIDGHDIEAVVAAAQPAPEADERPTAVILRTVMGKGVTFMEDKAVWHGGKLSREQAQEALSGLGPARGFQDIQGMDGTNVI